jgi:PadR family transcriptional regulator AphA
MSLKHAILVLLEKNPGSGYDLAQRFDGGIGNFWNATHQQVYQELKKLSSDKLVEFEVHAQAERPDKKVYRITPTGRTALKAWLKKPGKQGRINSTLLVKIYAAHLADPAALDQELAELITEHQQKLDGYAELERLYFSADLATRRKQRLPYLTLRSGIRYEWIWIEWMKEVKQLLADDALPETPMMELLAKAAKAKR